MRHKYDAYINLCDIIIIDRRTEGSSIFVLRPPVFACFHAFQPQKTSQHHALRRRRTTSAAILLLLMPPYIPASTLTFPYREQLFQIASYCNRLTHSTSSKAEDSPIAIHFSAPRDPTSSLTLLLAILLTVRSTKQ